MKQKLYLNPHTLTQRKKQTSRNRGKEQKIIYFTQYQENKAADTKHKEDENKQYVSMTERKAKARQRKRIGGENPACKAK